MYADVEARCQVWHQCYADRSWAFLCPNGTIFNQEIFTCVWWFDFDCSTAESFFDLNNDLYAGPTGGDGGSGGSTGGGSGGSTGGGFGGSQSGGFGGSTGGGSGGAGLEGGSNSKPAPVQPRPQRPRPTSAPLAPEPVIFEPTTPRPSIDPIIPIFDEPQAPNVDPVVPQIGPDSTYDEYDYSYEDEEYEIDPEQLPDEGEGYNYPVPENPLELPEKPKPLEPVVDDSIAPLALYGAPAQPFELPPDSLPTAAPEAPAEEELPLAQYLPPAAPRQSRRLGRRGRRRGQRKKRVISLKKL